MKTDRELLELAAKAAGIDGSYGEVHPEFGNDWHDTGIWYCDELDCTSCWNPLQDDGDALRLAVKLGIEIHPDREVDEVVTAFCVRNPALIGLNTIEEFNGDEMAAARRAITRAAAQIQLNKEQANG